MLKAIRHNPQTFTAVADAAILGLRAAHVEMCLESFLKGEPLTEIKQSQLADMRDSVSEALSGFRESRRFPREMTFGEDMLDEVNASQLLKSALGNRAEENLGFMHRILDRLASGQSITAREERTMHALLHQICIFSEKRRRALMRG